MKLNVGRRVRHVCEVPVIVLCKLATGLATVRSLAAAGVEVHAFIFDRDDPLWWSRLAHKIDVSGLEHREAEWIARLITCARGLGGRPVVFPTSDALALSLARHADTLSATCRVSSTSLPLLQTLIQKERLYAAAQAGGLPVLPFLFSPTTQQISDWSAVHGGPYLLKPSFVGAMTSPGPRNQSLADRAALLEHDRQHQLQGVLVQPRKTGGDGEIFDTYGCTDKSGQIIAHASHRRWRQFLPHLGSTCYGEIPAQLPAQQEAALQRFTQQLLHGLPYHGIFGIEWLRDVTSGDFYLLDFNARPFLCIGHLRECGLNLPWLAYRDLLGWVPNPVPVADALRPSLWLDFRRDVYARWSTPALQRSGLGHWLTSQLKASSYAYWSLSDPGPWLRATLQLVAG